MDCLLGSLSALPASTRRDEENWEEASNLEVPAFESGAGSALSRERPARGH